MKLDSIDLKLFFEEKNFNMKFFMDTVKQIFPLFTKVATQMGYDLDISNEDKLKQNLIYVFSTFKDIYNYGMKNGIVGFIYCREIEEFFNKYRDEILNNYEDILEFFDYKNFLELCTNLHHCKNNDYIYLQLIDDCHILKNDIVLLYIEYYIKKLFKTDMKYFINMEDF